MQRLKPIGIKAWYASTNLGSLYSLPSTCGCSAILPGGVRVLFAEKLEKVTLVAHLRIISDFLQTWRSLKAESSGLPAHTVLVRNYRSHTSPDHIGLKIFTPPTWIRTKQRKRGQPFYLRSSTPNVRIYLRENDLEKGIAHYSISAIRQIKFYLASKERLMALNMQNFRGVWHGNELLSPSSSPNSSDQFKFWEIKEPSKLISDPEKSEPEQVEENTPQVAVQYFESKQRAVDWLVSEGIHVDRRVVASHIIPSVKYDAPLNSQEKTTPHSSSTNVNHKAAPNVVISSKSRIPIARKPTLKKYIPSESETSENRLRTHRLARTIRSTDSLMLTESTRRNHELKMTQAAASKVASPPNTVSQSLNSPELVTMKRYVAQFETMFADMKKDLQIADLERRITELKLDLHRAQEVEVSPTRVINKQRTPQATQSVPATSLPELTVPPVILQRTDIITNKFIKNTKISKAPKNADLNSRRAPFTRINHIAPAHAGFSKEKSSEYKPAYRPVVSSEVAHKASEERVRNMQYEFRKLAGTMRQEADTKSAEEAPALPADHRMKTAEIQQEAIVAVAPRPKKPELAWGKTFTTLPKQAESSSAVPRPSSSVEGTPSRDVEGVSRPSLLSWLASVAPKQKENRANIDVQSARLER